MYVKYPRTYHHPLSPGVQSDDKVISTMEHMLGKRCVITEKMDGENSSLYRDHYHARSIDSKHHESRDWLKRFHASIAHDIPVNIRICGENLYAKHSIHYHKLQSYFYGFGVWDGNMCLSWGDSLEWFDLLGIQPVPVLFEGILTSIRIAKIASKMNFAVSEGFVIRVVDSFLMGDFPTHVCKYVRKGHVQTGDHWMHQSIIANNLRPLGNG